MTREEIGSYLGLKLETVSRTLSKFVDDQIVEVNQRHLRTLMPMHSGGSSIHRPAPSLRRRHFSRGGFLVHFA